MAKGDKNKAQNVADVAKNQATNRTTNMLTDTVIPVTQDSQNAMTRANQQAEADYGRLMGEYQNFTPERINPVSFDPISAERVNYKRTPEFNEGMGYYRDFAKTGGLSEDDRYALRERGISPIRSVYSNMKNEMIRKKALDGGYSPNFNAASSRMARESADMIGNQVNNVNAQIAEMVQQGKMFGTQGFGNMSAQDLQLLTQTALQNAAAENAARQFNSEGALRSGLANADITGANNAANLNKINAQANLYSATPGLANSFANQFSNNLGAWMQGENMLNNTNQQAFNNQMQVAQIPSNFETGLGRVGNIAKIAGGLIAPFMGGGVNSMIPSHRLASSSPYYTGPQL